MQQGDHDLGAADKPEAERPRRKLLPAGRCRWHPADRPGQIAADVAANGNFVALRAYGPVPRDHMLAREEVFGPVLALMVFRDEADAIDPANQTDYGLVAGVWSRDGSRAIRVARQIKGRAGLCQRLWRGARIELPFGGMKKSGHGREKGFDA